MRAIRKVNHFTIPVGPTEPSKHLSSQHNKYLCMKQEQIAMPRYHQHAAEPHIRAKHDYCTRRSLPGVISQYKHGSVHVTYFSAPIDAYNVMTCLTMSYSSSAAICLLLGITKIPTSTLHNHNNNSMQYTWPLSERGAQCNHTLPMWVHMIERVVLVHLGD